MKIYYIVKNWFFRKKPYFSKEKFLRNQSRYIKSEKNKEHFNSMMVELLNNNEVWFSVMDGEQLIQIGKEEFKFKKNVKFFYPSILKYWVEWK